MKARTTKLSMSGRAKMAGTIGTFVHVQMAGQIAGVQGSKLALGSSGGKGRLDVV
jgi:hypothetical protein